MSTLENAIAIAVKAHRHQKDKEGAPYILHPLRVMMRMNTETEMMTAVLHDVVEDSDWTIDGLRAEGFPEEVVQIIELLTKREGEPYEEYVKRAAGNGIARRIKIADLEDNMNMQRCRELTGADFKRYQKYHGAWRKLTGKDGT